MYICGYCEQAIKSRGERIRCVHIDYWDIVDGDFSENSDGDLVTTCEWCGDETLVDDAMLVI